MLALLATGTGASWSANVRKGEGETRRGMGEGAEEERDGRLQAGGDVLDTESA